MQEITPQKLLTCDADVPGFVGLPVFNCEGHMGLADVLNTAIANSTFVDVTTQIFDRVVAITKVFNVSVPLDFPACIDEVGFAEVLCPDFGEQQVFESFGENAARHKPLLFGDNEIENVLLETGAAKTD